MIIDTKEIEKYISKLLNDEPSDLAFPNYILTQLESDIQKLYGYDLNTIIKLQNAVNRYKKKETEEKAQYKQRLIESQSVNYIGIDVGKTRIITASNYEMNDYVVLKEKNITSRIKIYNQKIDYVTKIKDYKSKEELLSSLKADIKHLIRENILYKLKLKFREPTVYVIGKHFLNEDKYSAQNALTECVYESLKEAMENNDFILKVEYVNERYTSVRCPECKKGSPENRSKSGFECCYCHFYHKRPDIVACRNMLDNYYEIKKGEYNNFQSQPK